MVFTVILFITIGPLANKRVYFFSGVVYVLSDVFEKGLCGREHFGAWVSLLLPQARELC
jgi:hypothetical protein